MDDENLMAPASSVTVAVAGAPLQLEVRQFAGAPNPPGSTQSRPTIVYLHEGLGSAGLWRDFPASVAAQTGCPGLTYSRPGYGQSSACVLPRKTDYMHEEARQVLPALLRHFDLKDIILYGHSDGASIAMIYAGDAAAATGKRDLPVLRQVVLEAPHLMVETVLVDAVVDVVAAYEQGDLRRRLQRHHGANVDNAFYGWADIWRLPAFFKWSLEKEVSAIQVPMLALQGEDDPYATLAQLQTLGRIARCPYRQVLLPDCAHAPHKDQSARVLKEVTQFIQHRSAT